MKNAVVLILVAGLVLFTTSPSKAQSLTVMHNFDGTNGYQPQGDLVLGGSVLYGTTRTSGSGYGAIFSIPINGGTLKNLYRFNWHDDDPEGSLTLSADGSLLFGMTVRGFGGGIYSIPVTGGAPTTLYSSASLGDGPKGKLTLSKDGSLLYGTRPDKQGCLGDIFSMPVGGGPLQTLFAFPYGGESGQSPTGFLTPSSDGLTLYGMTNRGGNPNSPYGVVFSIPVTGGTAKTVCQLIDSHLGHPYGGLVLNGSTLYGMTPYSGTVNCGGVFSVPTSGGTATVLSKFTDIHNVESSSLAISPDGSTLYGFGPTGGANGLGTIFSLPVSGGSPTILYSFDGTHGRSPQGTPTLSPDGLTIYGTTAAGGAYGYGEIFALSVPEPSTIALLITTFLSAVGCVLARTHRR
jgi:uncharacterized repeat protein (TIGR03803 family)